MTDLNKAKFKAALDRALEEYKLGKVQQLSELCADSISPECRAAFALGYLTAENLLEEEQDEEF